MKTIITLSLISFVIASCTPQPVVKQFADAKHWVVVRPLHYKSPKQNISGTVPAGFVTDFASVPKALWGGISPHGRYSSAAIVHDYHYWNQDVSRKRADGIMLDLMEQARVSRVKRGLMYRTLRVAGGAAWKANKRDRLNGDPRVIPVDKIDAIPEDATWPEYQKTLPRTRQ